MNLKCNAWCGILNGRIIGPYVFEETLNGSIYHNFLENHLPVLLENVKLHI